MVGDIFQPTHLLFVLIIALLVLGPKRLPEVGRTLGSSIRDFREAINGATGGITGSHDGNESEPWHSAITQPTNQSTAPAPATATPTAPMAESPMPSSHANGTEAPTAGFEPTTSDHASDVTTVDGSLAPEPDPEPEPAHETPTAATAAPATAAPAAAAPAPPASADAPAPPSQS